jgi:hypothetical protein
MEGMPGKQVRGCTVWLMYVGVSRALFCKRCIVNIIFAKKGFTHSI